MKSGNFIIAIHVLNGASISNPMYVHADTGGTTSDIRRATRFKRKHHGDTHLANKCMANSIINWLAEHTGFGPANWPVLKPEYIDVED